jgi:peroxiredoxin
MIVRGRRRWPASDIARQERSMDETAAAIPAVGQEAPDFTLPASTGDTITLSQYRGERNVVLAFYVFDWTGG